MVLSVKPIGERFWSKVKKTTDNVCWLWLGSKDRNGYGRIWDRDKGTSEYAHRISWRLTSGTIEKGQQLLHKCDNPSCVRPDHLFLGSVTDNVVDMVLKDRSGLAKLTVNDVKTIRKLHKNSGISIKNLASMYGLKYCSMWDVLNRSWRSVK